MPPNIRSLVTLSALAMIAAGSGIMESPPPPGAGSGRRRAWGGYPREYPKYIPPPPDHIVQETIDAAAEKRVRKAAKRLGIQPKICSSCAKLFVKGVIAYGMAELCSVDCVERLEHAIDETTPSYEMKAGA